MGNDKVKSPLEKAQTQFSGFEDGFKSVVLATVNGDGFPHSSYAPFVSDDDHNLYFFLSGMTQHTKNLEDNGKLCVLFVEDESTAGQIFARKRLTYEAAVTKVSRDDESWEQICSLFDNKFDAKLINQFRGMPDFRIFKAKLRKGRFVFGFGSAYELTGDKLDTLAHVKGGAGAHGSPHGNPHGNPHVSADKSQGELLNEESIKRILGHMNAGHSAAIVNYAKVFADEIDTTAAELIGLDELGIDLKITTNGTEKEIRILFKEKISTAAEAHDILVSMARAQSK